MRQTAHAHPPTLSDMPGFLVSTEYSWPSSSASYGRGEAVGPSGLVVR
ncbi:hypothetical protein [Streptomyces sp. NBC_00459]